MRPVATITVEGISGGTTSRSSADAQERVPPTAVIDRRYRGGYFPLFALLDDSVARPLGAAAVPALVLLESAGAASSLGAKDVSSGLRKGSCFFADTGVAGVADASGALAFRGVVLEASTSFNDVRA